MYSSDLLQTVDRITTITSIVSVLYYSCNYKFVYVDVGCNGRVSDGGVFRNSNLFAALEGNSLNIPPPEPLTQQDFNLPYMLVADYYFAHQRQETAVLVPVFTQPELLASDECLGR